MKRLWTITCVILAVFALTACSSSKKSTKKDEQTTEKQGLEKDEKAASEEGSEEKAEEKTKTAEKSDTSSEESGDAPCLAQIEGASFKAEKADGAWALHFMSSNGNTDELRKGAQWMTNHHNEVHGHTGEASKGRGRGMGKGKGKGKHGVMGMAKAKYEETDDGARVVFTPAKESHMTGLQKQVEEHAKWLNSGQCPGQKMKGQKMQKGEKSKGQGKSKKAPAESKEKGEAKPAEEGTGSTGE